jgi:hypothetical protein
MIDWRTLMKARYLLLNILKMLKIEKVEGILRILRILSREIRPSSLQLSPTRLWNLSPGVCPPSKTSPLFLIRAG